MPNRTEQMLHVSLLVIIASDHQHGELFATLTTRCTKFGSPLNGISFALNVTTLFTTQNCKGRHTQFHYQCCSLLCRHLCPSAIDACRPIHYTNGPWCLLFATLPSSSPLSFASSLASRLPHIVASLLRAQVRCVCICWTRAAANPGGP